jgi:argininosuccinate lyase
MDIAGKLHTGRSRNDQSGTDGRLWLRDNLEPVTKWLKEFISVLVSRAEFEIEHLMPGYTHLRRAQPVRWSHWILNHASAFVFDLQRLNEVLVRINYCPYGIGALAGNSFGVDRDAIVKELGFTSLVSNSL